MFFAFLPIWLITNKTSLHHLVIIYVFFIMGVSISLPSHPIEVHIILLVFNVYITSSSDIRECSKNIDIEN